MPKELAQPDGPEHPHSPPPQPTEPVATPLELHLMKTRRTNPPGHLLLEGLVSSLSLAVSDSRAIFPLRGQDWLDIAAFAIRLYMEGSKSPVPEVLRLAIIQLGLQADAEILAARDPE